MRTIASGNAILTSAIVVVCVVASRTDYASAVGTQTAAQTQPAKKQNASQPLKAPRNLARAMAERGDLRVTDVALNAMLRFELKQADFLHRLAVDQLDPDPDQAQALALVFANYIRRTVERRARPVLIGYPQAPPVETTGGGADIVLSPAFQTQEQVDASGQPLYLVAQAVAALKPEQVKPFRETVERWKILRQGITDGPLKRLYRSLMDPKLSLPMEKLAVLVPMLQNAIEGLSSKERRQLDRMIKIEEKTRTQILKQLSPDQQQHLAKVRQMLQDYSAEWQKPGHGEQLYIDAVRLEQRVKAGS